ncbi:hypothetical protein [Cupriavidus cauae]|uniref:Uncharacterized protein n=1 Tax=Cupriavidus cauae TaxID=2608999 RepID=A0A5M8B0A7_9BURK|nr:hypothetical protein [Cupriavidus cauae]KAA6129308.1 hypothetical protein F1599_06090 [Cupriavidus cauae]
MARINTTAAHIGKPRHISELARLRASMRRAEKAETLHNVPGGMGARFFIASSALRVNPYAGTVVLQRTGDGTQAAKGGRPGVKEEKEGERKTRGRS